MCQAPARHAHCPMVSSISLADARLLRLNFTRTESFSAKNALTALDSRNTQSCEIHVSDSSARCCVHPAGSCVSLPRSRGAKGALTQRKEMLCSIKVGAVKQQTRCSGKESPPCWPIGKVGWTSLSTQRDRTTSGPNASGECFHVHSPHPEAGSPD